MQFQSKKIHKILPIVACLCIRTWMLLFKISACKLLKANETNVKYCQFINIYDEKMR